MNKKTLRIITIISTIVLVICLASLSFAMTPGELKANESNTTGIYNIGQTVMGIIQAAGIVIAVVVLMVLGIKYMMGSAQEKAEYKKTMIPYVIGAVLIFAAATIANVVYNFASGIKS